MDFEKQSIEILKMMCGNNGCWILDSGGKDSSILKHIALKSGIPFKIEHSHTTVDAPETVYFIRREKQRFEQMGIEYLIEYPKLTMWQLIVKNGMPPTRLARYCCKELKENFGVGKRIATGVRKAESRNRAENQGVVTIPKPSIELKERIDNVNFHQTDRGGW
jgi:3'-phosphoadenosine 5'-phosphosulfate sulfotransferase (PAPS reductase)/FAD synthetase